MNFRYRAVCFFKKGRTGGSASFAQKQAQRKAHHEQKKMYRFLHVRTVRRRCECRKERKNLYYLSEMPYRVCKEKLEKSLKSNVGIQMAKCLKKKLDKMRKEK